MGYRRDGKKVNVWSHWLKVNAELINESHLPAFLLETEDDWVNFLIHGYFEWFDSFSNPLPWFHLEKMPQEHLAAVLALVEAYPGGIDTHTGRLVRDLLSKRTMDDLLGK